MKIAITGATGQLGQYVIESLLKKIDASQIIALVRTPNQAQNLRKKGIEIRHFDYDQPNILSTALLGIDKLLLISSNKVGHRVPQHRAVIEAAIQSKVPHIIYTSLLRANTSTLSLAQEHRETEAMIMQSGLNYTLLRNNWYSDNYLAGLTHTLETGILLGSANDGKISAASRQDYAEAAANVLIQTGHENTIYELAGSNSFSLAQLAQFISTASGKAVQYQNLASDEYSQTLAEAGLNEGLIHVIVDADVQTQVGAMLSNSKDLETLLGRPSTPILTTVLNTLNKLDKLDNLV